jgi:hypothetical protein
MKPITNLPPDTELETELQELYILAKHWLQDISFMEEELQFFKNILQKYQHTGVLNASLSKHVEFSQKIEKQEMQLNALKTKIPVFIAFLEPFIGNLKAGIDINFLTRHNALETELQELFTAVRATKKDLFTYTESVMTAEIPR